MDGGNLFWDDTQRLTLLALLLENVGADQMVRLGDLQVWREAVRELGRRRRAGVRPRRRQMATGGPQVDRGVRGVVYLPAPPDSLLLRDLLAGVHDRAVHSHLLGCRRD
jgi:hypothetical protein